MCTQNQPEALHICGRVLHPDGAARANAVIKVHLRQFRAAATVGNELAGGWGTTTTGADGRFDIYFSTGGHDVVVVAYDGDLLPDLVPIAESPSLYGVQGHVEFDLVLGGQTYVGPTEYGQIASAYSTHTINLSLTPAMISDADVRDLAGLTKIDPVRIAAFVLAQRMFAETTQGQLQAAWVPQALYALTTSEAVRSLDEVRAMPDDVRRSVIASAVDRHVIEPVTSGDLDTLRDFLVNRQQTQALEVGPNLGATIGNVLAAAGLQPGQATALYQEYMQRVGSVQDFWADLRSHQAFAGDPDQVDHAQFALTCAAITGNNQPAVLELLADFPVATSTIRSLASRSTEDWKSWLDSKNIEPPSFIEGPSLSDRRQTYAEQMAALVERAIPTPVFTARIAVSPQSNESDLVGFLQHNSGKDFEFETDRFARYVREKNINLASIGDAAKITAQANEVQRLFPLVPAVNRASSVRALRAQAFDSASKIAAAGRKRFVKRMNIEGMSESDAQAIYREASRASSMALALFADRAKAFRHDELPITREQDTFSEYPEIAALFGSLDACDCGACRSAFGPAAYLADLLFFLEQCGGEGKSRDNAEVPTALQALKLRRPDITKVKLSCDNANRLLPAIDLAIEVLEVEVERVANGTIDDSAYLRQTTDDTTVDLRVEPEHRRDAAYTALSNIDTVWTLPYHLATDEALGYLSLSGVKPADFAGAVAPEHTPAERSLLARLELGASPERFDRLISDTTAMAEQLFGGAIPSSKKLLDLMTRFACTLEDLQALAASDYVNKGKLSAISNLEIEIDDCSLDSAESVMNNLDAERVRRMYRVLWLRSSTGLSIAQVSAMMDAVGEPAAPPTPSFSPAAVVRFGEARRLQRRFGFTPEEVVAIANARTDSNSWRAAFARVLGSSPADFDKLRVSLEVDPNASSFVDDAFRWAERELDRLAAVVEAGVPATEVHQFVLDADATPVPVDEVIFKAWDAIRAVVAEGNARVHQVAIEEMARVVRMQQSSVETLLVRGFAALGDLGPSDTITPAFVATLAANPFATQPFKDLVRRCAKVARFFESAGIDDAAVSSALRWLKNAGFAFASIAVGTTGTVPANIVPHLVELCRARRYADTTGAAQSAVFDLLLEGTPASGLPNASALFDKLARVSSLSITVIAELATKLAIQPSVAGQELAWRSTRALTRILAVSKALSATGLSSTTMQTLVSFSTSAIATEVKDAAKAKLGAGFAAAVTPVVDARRQRQRDALVAYLVSKWNLRSADDLYPLLLVDVELSPCMQSTRILHATSCVQNLLQRASMNLDASIDWPSTTTPSTTPDLARAVLDSDDARTWGWMKNYRVWEAARRVLLYPENYLEPELRPDATQAFDDMSRVLEQGEIDDRAAEDAFRAYLRTLEEVSSLDVCAMTMEARSSSHKVFHVFGRSRGAPKTYHYCKYDSQQGWSAWQPTKLDIGDSHLVPVLFRGRLYVYWPMFVEKKLGKKLAPIDENGVEEPLKHWEVRIAGARYEDGRWTQGSVSQHAVYSTQFVEKSQVSMLPTVVGLEYVNIAFSHPVSAKRYKSESAAYRLVFGVLRTFDGVSFEKLSDAPYVAHARQFFSPPGTNREESRFASDGSLVSLSIPALHRNGRFRASYRLFNSGVGRFSLVQRGDAQHFVGAWPFFYVDRERAYFIVPAGLSDPTMESFRKPDSIVLEYVQPALEGSVYPGLREPDPGPASGTLGGAVFAGALRDRAGNPRGISANAGAGRVIAPDTFAPLAGLVVRGIEGGAGRSGELVGFDGGAAVDGMLDSEYTVVPMVPERPFSVRATRFDHPFVQRVRTQLERWGIDSVFAPPAGSDLSLLRQSTIVDDFAARYQPTYAVDFLWPAGQFDFASESPNSAYNWELFFYAPWTISNRLRSQQKYSEALRWMRFIFDPTDASNGTGPERFWRFKPLADDARDSSSRESLLDLLDYTGTDGARRARRTRAERAIAQWRRDPFEPHAVARIRPVAYQRAIAMRMVELLIEWGDSAFRRATRESVQEAAQLYVTASGLLGRRPKKLPARAVESAKNYEELVATPPSAGIVAIEAVIPRSELGSDESELDTVIGPSLLYADGSYFCVPMNDELLRSWDLVADRLFKIRHCQDIEGAALDLPLYEPPIDPRLLVRARSMGVSIADAISSGASVNASPYRFNYLLARAVDFANDVRGMGSTLLSTLEKRDAEELSQVRQTLEREMSAAIRRVREQQASEAKAQRETLDQSKALAERRAEYYRTLIAQNLNAGERQQLAALKRSREFLDQVFGMELGSKYLSLLPDLANGVSGATGTPLSYVMAGGTMFSRYFDMVGHAMRHAADRSSFEGTMAQITGQYERRKVEWEQQLSQTEGELVQIDKQIVAADIRLAIAENELRNHELAYAHSERTARFLGQKFTNRALYDWMIRRLTVLHRQAYTLAFDLAIKAQIAFRDELGDESAPMFVRYGQWDSQRSGLLAGDELFADLRRMEAAFMQRNTRPFEITKTVSLAALDPVALVRLRTTGECFVTMPEAIFDADHPDHIQRVIRSVSFTVPSVSSAFDSVPMKVTRSGGVIRLPDGSTPATVARGARVENVVLSHGQNDSGLFEVSLRDERLLPFEGAGLVDSVWELSLSNTDRVFDYQSIADVVFTIRYTARASGTSRNVRTGLNGAERNASNSGFTGDTTGGFMLISMKNDLPAEWQAYLSSTASVRSMDVPLPASKFPYLAERAGGISIKSVRAVVVHKTGAVTPTMTVTNAATPTPTTVAFGDWNGVGTPAGASTALATATGGVGTWKIRTEHASAPVHLTDANHADLLLIVRYEMSAT